MNLLLTGFEPFLNYSINPTEKIVKLLDLIDITVHKAILPVDFEKTRIVYAELLDEIQPDIILNLGLNAKAISFELETFALNVAKDFRKPPESIDEKTDLALKTTIDTFEMAQHLRDAGIPAKGSHHAGDYLCNYVFYRSLQYTNDTGGQALFIHMPYTADLAASIYSKEQQDFPSLSTDVILEGISLIVKRLLVHDLSV